VSAAANKTNTTTHFLREIRALQMIRDLVAIPNLAAGRKTVVWSVGCSTGDEPYGLAMLCRQAACEVDVLATDVNPDALERAQSGRYHSRNLRHVSAELRDRWFVRDGDSWQIAAELRDQVRFRRHDITQEGAPRHDVDVALCRNVMVYFNAAQIQRAVATIVTSLRPGALLIIGASEWLRGDLRVRGTTRLLPMEKAGVIVYQRVDGATLIAPAAQRATQPVTQPTAQPAPPPPLQLPLSSDASRIVEQLRALGDTLLDAARPTDASACYAKAIEHAPLLADLHLRIALCHLHTREPKLATESLRRALFLTPQLWQAWLLMADLAHGPGQVRRYLDQARALLESATEQPDHPALRVFAGDQATALAAVRHRLRGLR
jgi:chemotaxis methyl-accepting protein methylase